MTVTLLSLLKKPFSVGLFLMAFSFQVFSQKDLDSGYIITYKNEKLTGLINNKTNSQNSEQCFFQKNINSPVIIFTPADIKVYRTNTKYYVAKEIKTDSVIRLLFLEYLVDGIVDLYYLKNNFEEYYFIEKDSTLVPLENKLIGRKVAEHTFYDGSGQYIRRLSYLFQDAPALHDEISRTRFHYKSIVNLTKDYHNLVCTDYECIDYTYTKKVKSVFLEAGIGIYSTNLYLETSDDKANNIRPAARLQLRFVPFRDKFQLSFLIGAGVTSNNLKGYFNNDLFKSNTSKVIYITEKYTLISIPVNFEYTFGSGRIQPFISAGYSINLMPDFNFSAFDYYDDDYYPQDSHYSNKFRHGFNGGAGLRYCLKNSNYLFAKCNYEYRGFSVVQRIYLVDYTKYKLLLFNFGYAIGW